MEGEIAGRIEARREEFQERIENGEALTREDILRPLREDQRAFQQRERLQRLRQMSPEQRREALRQLPPEQRRALREAWQERRDQRPGEQAPLPPADTAPAPADLSRPGTPAAEPPR